MHVVEFGADRPSTKSPKSPKSRFWQLAISAVAGFAEPRNLDGLGLGESLAASGHEIGVDRPKMVSAKLGRCFRRPNSRRLSRKHSHKTGTRQ